MNLTPELVMKRAFPGWNHDEWNKDHCDFVLNDLLPMVMPRKTVAQVIEWAYRDGMERRSNGSSVVPDVTYPFGRIKDPVGVGHDWIFELARKHLADPSGHVWTLWEANRWYYQGMVDFRKPVRGAVRWVGLTLGSWALWTWR